RTRLSRLRGFRVGTEYADLDRARRDTGNHERPVLLDLARVHDPVAPDQGDATVHDWLAVVAHLAGHFRFRRPAPGGQAAECESRADEPGPAHGRSRKRAHGWSPGCVVESGREVPPWGKPTADRLIAPARSRRR